MLIESNISQTIDITEESARYDESIKELFADKQILARILKYSLEEFEFMEIEDIIASMDEPQISSIRMEPGQTNTEKIQKLSEEDSVKGEGKIFYDIRFNAYVGDEQIKFLINIEAQKSTKPSKLGYQLDNRIIYYLGRMVSAQKEVEFSNSCYDGLKAVRSIWICMDSNDEEDSINRIRLTEENVFGKSMKLPNIHKLQGVIIRLRRNENAEKSKNTLIAMLEELLKKDSASKKKQILEAEYGLVMTSETERRLNTMCNLSEAIMERELERGIQQGMERGIQQGMERGLQQGMERGIVQMILRLKDNGYQIEQISSMLDMKIDEIHGYLTRTEKTNED